MTRPNRTSRTDAGLGISATIAAIRYALINGALLLVFVWLPAFGFFARSHVLAQTSPTERHVIQKWAEAAAWAGIDVPNRPIQYGIEGSPALATAGAFAKAPRVLAIRDAVWNRVKKKLALFAVLALGITLCVRQLFVVFGGGIRGDAFLRGGWIATPRQLRRLIRGAGPLSPLQVGTIRLSQATECQHILLDGTTGTGKTVALDQLLSGVGREWRAVIYDTKGEFLSRTFADGDVILNPIDERCPAWTPWNEILHSTDAARIAKALIASQSPQDSYWIDASRALLADLLLSVPEDRRTNAELYRLCAIASTDELKQLLAGTLSARLFDDPGSERMRESVRNTLLTSVRGLQLLQPDARAGEGFSITHWVRAAVEQEGQTGRVFLFCPPDHAPAIGPVIAVWIESAAAAVLGLGPSRSRRILFAIDELPTLPVLEYLQRLAAEGRGYGVCLIAAIQSRAQLKQRYGNDGADALTALFSTRLVFRAADKDSAEHASQLLGEEEVDVARETEGAAARSNHSVSADQRMRRLVTTTEILLLPNLQCYLHVPGEFPIARLTLKPSDVADVVSAFVPRDPATLIHRPRPAAPRAPTPALSFEDEGPI